MRFHLPPAAWTGETLTLGAAESHHAASVLRAATGDRVTVIDGAGRVADAEIVRVTKGGVSLRVIESRVVPRPATRLVLAVAVAKGRVIEWIIEKAVELGATEVVPLVTERTIVRVAPGERAGRREKWERVAIEAAKQCGQPWLPTIHPPTPFPDALAALRTAEAELRLVGSLEAGALPLREWVAEFAATAGHPPRSATIVVGPEGDLTPDEYAAARDAGFRPVTLGPIVLRVETAALWALSVVRYELAR